jgi:hypothetical protein
MRQALPRLIGMAAGFTALSVLPSSCASSPPEGELLREVERLMAAYAVDLEGADREALGRRYDPRGVHLIFNGENEFLSFDSIGAIYRGEWQPPGRFRWDTLTYELLGPDAVLVVGSFTWEGEGIEGLPVSYTGVLMRQPGGEWRIRLENEAIPPEAMRGFLCPEG